MAPERVNEPDRPSGGAVDRDKQIGQLGQRVSSMMLDLRRSQNKGGTEGVQAVVNPCSPCSLTRSVKSAIPFEAYHLYSHPASGHHVTQ
jgi:hypothetical protein